MRCNGAIFLGSILLMLFASGRAQGAEQEIRVTPLNPGKTIGTFGRAEWIVDVGQVPSNPFDPDQIAVDATFTAPSGKTVIVPAFWDSPEGGNSAMPRPGFVVRFAPTEPGAWSFNVAVVEPSGKRSSAVTTFQVEATQDRGFIRRAANNRYFQFDSGASYFPVGMNVCWASSDAAPAQWYEDKFKTLSQTARISFGFGCAIRLSCWNRPKRGWGDITCTMRCSSMSCWHRHKTTASVSCCAW